MCSDVDLAQWDSICLDFPDEPLEGVFSYGSQEGDFSYELQEGDFSYELQEGDFSDEPTDSPEPASPNNQDRYESEPNNDVTGSPASSSSSAHQSPSRCKQKKKKRKEYGNGPEHQKLLKMPHFGQPFKHLYFFEWLGKPKKERLIKIGKKYNEDFQQEIFFKKLPKFTRDHSRRQDLAYFFFEDNMKYIIPWFTKIRTNSPDF